jgi:phosphotriesterase-related protein
VPGAALPEHLGVCDAHDHLFLGSPRPPGQEPRGVTAARAGLAAFRELGGGSVVQWTSYGLGRRAADLPPLSRRTGVQAVAAKHQGGHYDEGGLRELRGRLAEVFVAELTEGIGTSGVRRSTHRPASARTSAPSACRAVRPCGASVRTGT